MNYLRIELLDKLAAEYVVGTLHGGARRRFQRLLREHPSAMAAVQSWEERLAPMAMRLDAAEPSTALWTAIHRRIDPSMQREAARKGFNWRGFGSLISGLALGVIGMAVVLPLVGPTKVEVPEGRVLPESYAGILRDASGNAALLVSSLRRGKTADIKVLRPVALAPGQSLQLWALAKDTPPLALGPLVPTGKSQITMPGTSEELLAKTTELAVSIEPAGSRPTQPSGPFVLRGHCAKFW